MFTPVARLLTDAPTRRDSPLHDVVDLPPVFPNATVEMDCTQYITRGAGSHVKWWYNGRVVKHGSGEHAWTLSTNNSQPGIFQCIVHNAYGAASVTYRVRVPGMFAASFVVRYAINTAFLMERDVSILLHCDFLRLPDTHQSIANSGACYVESLLPS